MASKKSRKPRVRVRTSAFDDSHTPAEILVGGAAAWRFDDGERTGTLHPAQLWFTLRVQGFDAAVHLNADSAEDLARRILAKVEEVRAAGVVVHGIGGTTGRTG